MGAMPETAPNNAKNSKAIKMPIVQIALKIVNFVVYA